MTLKDHAYLIDYAGKSQLVIEDGALLVWARKNQMRPAQAQVSALREGIIPLRYLKNFRGLQVAEQARLCASKVVVCGCGGLGGIVTQLLARAGVGELRLVDGDVFCTSNLNRQLLCTTPLLSRPKAQVAEETVQAINPLIDVKAHPQKATAANVTALLQGADLVIDALDNLPSRFLVADAARTLKIAFLHAAVAGWWGQISTFPAESKRELKSIYGERTSREPQEISLGVLGPTAAAIGSMQALEAIRLLTGRTPAYADKLLYFDGENGLTQIVPL